MPHALAQAVEMATTALAVTGIGYFLAAMVAAWVYLGSRNALSAASPQFSPGVSILKSLKGLDPGMMDAFRSHCRQNYAGELELLFGVSSLADPAAAAVELLKNEFPELRHPAHRVPGAAGNERQGEHSGAACRARLLRFPAHQRLRHYGFSALSGAGDDVLYAQSHARKGRSRRRFGRARSGRKSAPPDRSLLGW